MNRGRHLPVAAVLFAALLAGCGAGEGQTPEKTTVRVKKEAARGTGKGGAPASDVEKQPLQAKRDPAPVVATTAAAIDGAVLDDLLLTPEPYYYESLGRRDLFESLVSQDYVDENPPERPSSGQLRVVGILWAENDRFALVETQDGKNRILREGDAIGDGTVIQVLPDRVIIHVTEYGTSRRVSLPLVEGGGFDESPKYRRR